LRKNITNEKITVILELRSNTMKTGYFNDELIDSLKGADEVLVFKELINAPNATTYDKTDDIIKALKNQTGHIIFYVKWWF
jgi:UDP-N-acetylmuramate-alanine ligase